MLSDGYLGNGAEPWKIKSTQEMPEIQAKIANKNEDYQPYARDNKTLARKLALPGTKGLEHRIGGLEKEDVTGDVSYDANNHEKMVGIRSSKIKKLVKFIKMKMRQRKTSKIAPLTQVRATYSGTLTLSSLSYHWMEKQIDTIRWD